MTLNAPVARRRQSSRDLVSAPGSTNLADLLERVLDKGVIIAGEIVISLGTVELLTLKLRVLIASIDKAREIGIDWWESDPFLSSHARERELEGESDLLKKRLDRLEHLLLAPPQEADQEYATATQWSNTAPAYILDKQGRVVGELKQPGQQAHEAEQPQARKPAPWPVQQPHEEAGLQAQERAPQPHEEEQLHTPEHTPQAEATQAEQAAGAEPLLGTALHERIAQAMRAVLERLPQRIAQAGQPGEQARPQGRHDEEQPQEQEPPQAPQPGSAQNAAPARVLEEEGRMSAKLRHGRVTWRLAVVDLDREGRVIAEPTQPVEQVQEVEGRPVQERAPQAGPAQAEQPAGAGSLLVPALHKHLAQAVRPVLEELRQRNALARQSGEQARLVG